MPLLSPREGIWHRVWRHPFVASFWAAWSLLTVLPGPRGQDPWPEKAWVCSVVWFPLIGGILGGLLALLDVLLDSFPFPPLVKGGLLVLFYLVLTRGLHLDGLADATDGLFGGWDPQQRLDIMRDARIGAFGAAAVGLALLLKAAALAAVPRPALWAVPVWSHWAMSAMVVLFPYAREQGLGKPLAARSARWRLVPGTLLALGLSAFWWPWGWGLGALASTTAWLFATWLLRRVPGFTGDLYGALAEIYQALAWVVVSMMGK